MHAKFGDIFPAGLKEDFRKRNIIAGSVFKIYATNTNPPKYKIIVLVAVNDEVALVGYIFVNSDPSWHCVDTDELRNLQLFLSHDTRNYLDHDSYLDCSDLMSLPLSDLDNAFAADGSILLGSLSADDLEKVIKKVTGAKTISKKQKKLFGLL